MGRNRSGKRQVPAQVAKILVVEDEKTLADTVAAWLAMQEKHAVEVVNDGQEALEYLLALEYDAIVLDWNLPGMSGVELLREFRGAGGRTPVLMLTGKDRIDDKEEGLDSGADDYLTKPFEIKELAARLRALLRRPVAYAGTTMEIGKLKLDTRSRQATVDGRHIHLKPIEFSLLEFFMRHKDQVISTEALIGRVWGSSSEVSIDAVYTCINRLRRNLGRGKGIPQIKTVHGIGYKLVAL